MGDGNLGLGGLLGLRSSSFSSSSFSDRFERLGDLGCFITVLQVVVVTNTTKYNEIQRNTTKNNKIQIV